MIIPGRFNGDRYTDLLFYGPNVDIEGRALGQFYTTNGRGGMNLLKSNSNLDPNWDIIVPGNYNGDTYTDLLFYGSTLGQFYTTNGRGEINQLSSFNNWNPKWGYIVPGLLNGDSRTDVFFYEKYVPGPDYIFPVHFAVITSTPDAIARATLTQLKNEIDTLNKYFVSEDGENPVYFEFKSATFWDEISDVDCDLVRWSNDGTEHSKDEWKFVINGCVDNEKVVDPKAINFFVYDFYSSTIGYSEITSRGHCRCTETSALPFVMLDYERLNHTTQSPEEHEMGHVFGLTHRCDPNSTGITFPTNIMASGGACRGHGGARNIGFDPGQIDTVLMIAPIFKRVFGL
jgi:hypothetical protein